MNLGKYIHQLLLENETVIIPGFGAFFSIYKPAQITETEIKPPSMEISFSQQIRNNDGLLVGFVSGQKKISHFEALKIIEKERENLIYQLDKGGKVELEKTGFLFYNEKNEIVFEPVFDENLLLDSFGLEPVLIKSGSENNLETVSPENPVAAEELDFAKKEEDEPARERKNSAGTLSGESEVPKQKIQPEMAKTVNVAPAYEQRKRSGVWYLLILIPILIAGIFVVQLQTGKEKIPSFTPGKVENKNSGNPQIGQAPNSKDSLNTENHKQDLAGIVNPDSSGVESVNSDNLDSLATGVTKFYLVGGSFKEEENAEKYLLELKEKGYKPFQLGKRGNFYIVGIGEYKTESEAVTAKREFTESNTGSGAWILEE